MVGRWQEDEIRPLATPLPETLMAKADLNSALRGLRGRIGDLIYKQYGDKVVVTRVPKFSGQWSKKQHDRRKKFGDASAYAERVRSDPELRAVYAPAAKKRRMAIRPFAIKDYLQAPIIRSIDTSSYTGCAGDPILIATGDAFKVVKMEIVVRGRSRAAIERGAASKLGADWQYVATRPCPAGEKVTFEITATDRAGNKSTLTDSRLLSPATN